jgi:hypothetical protein
MAFGRTVLGPIVPGPTAAGPRTLILPIFGRMMLPILERIPFCPTAFGTAALG